MACLCLFLIRSWATARVAPTQESLNLGECKNYTHLSDESRCLMSVRVFDSKKPNQRELYPVVKSTVESMTASLIPESFSRARLTRIESVSDFINSA